MKSFKEPLAKDCLEIFNLLLPSYIFVVPYGQRYSKRAFLHLLKQVYGGWKGRNYLFTCATAKCDFKTIERQWDGKIIVL